MEGHLLSYAEMITALKIALFLLALIVIFLDILYNILYLLKILNSEQQIGIYPPPYIHYLVRISISLSIGTAAFLILFFFFNII
jgi:hypothetical protein